MALDIVQEPKVIEPDELALHIATEEQREAAPVVEEGSDGKTPEVVEPKKEAAKPEPKAGDDIPTEHRVIDPETSEQFDGRTREGKRVRGLIERTKVAEAKAHAAEIRASAAALLADQTKPKEDAKPAPAADARPKPEDFATVEEYMNAAIDHGVKSALAADRAAQQATTAQREAEARNGKIREREAVFVTDHPDYREHIDAYLIPDLVAGVKAGHPTALALNQALSHSEQGPQLAYALSLNKGAEHARLAALPPELALIELGKLLHSDAKPSGEKPAKEEKRSSAPPPPEIVTGRSSAADANEMDMDFDTHVAIGNRKDAESSRSRRKSAAA